MRDIYEHERGSMPWWGGKNKRERLDDEYAEKKVRRERKNDVLVGSRGKHHEPKGDIYGNKKLLTPG